MLKISMHYLSIKFRILLGTMLKIVSKREVYRDLHNKYGFRYCNFSSPLLEVTCVTKAKCPDHNVTIFKRRVVRQISLQWSSTLR